MDKGIKYRVNTIEEEIRLSGEFVEVLVCINQVRFYDDQIVYEKGG